MPAREERNRGGDQRLDSVGFVHRDVTVGGHRRLERLPGKVHLQKRLEQRVRAEQLPGARRRARPNLGNQSQALLAERVRDGAQGAVQVHERVPPAYVRERVGHEIRRDRA